MKRKVIQLAGKTLLVSLPNKWVNNYNIKKGQEIEVTEEHNTLIIRADSSKPSATKEIDVTGIAALANRLTGAIYKAGYDEVRIIYSNAEELKEVQGTLKRTCLGYEIVEQTDRAIIVKEVTKLEAAQFKAILRRLFIFLNQIAIDTLTAIKKKDKEALKAIIMRDDTVNRYADFCRRILMKQGYEKIEKTPAMYYIVEELEKIGDIYKEICVGCAEELPTIDEKTEKAFMGINTMLKTFEELVYKYEHEKLDNFIKTRNKIRNELKKLYSEAKPKQLYLLFHLNNLMERIYDLNGALMVINE